MTSYILRGTGVGRHKLALAYPKSNTGAHAKAVQSGSDFKSSPTNPELGIQPSQPNIYTIKSCHLS